MQRFILEENIHNYRKLLETECDPARKKTLEQLLHSAEHELAILARSVSEESKAGQTIPSGEDRKKD